jgi:hypothetical protein
MTRPKAGVFQLVVLASYIVAAVGRTFPLVFKIATAFPAGHTDAFGFMWNNWWIYHAATHFLPKPYWTTYIFAPYRIDLRLHTVGFLYGLLSLPLMPLVGQVCVLNLQVFATMALNGFATFKITRRLIGDDRVAFICGFLVASTWSVNLHVFSGRPSCSAFWPAIFAMHYFMCLIERPTKVNTALFTLFLIATQLADQQIVLFGTLWLIILAVHAAIYRSPAVLNRRFLTAVGFAAFLGGIACYFLYFRPYWLDAGYNVPGAVEALEYSYGPASFVNPPLVWGMYGTIVPIGLLAGLALIRRVPRIGVWVGASFGFFLLAMGPVIHGTKVPLPFAVLQRLPGLANFRFPYRFLLPAAFGAVVATGVLLSWLLAKLSPLAQRRLVVAATFVAAIDLVGASLYRPFSTRTMPSHPFYEAIGRDDRDCVVLEIPVGVRTGTDRIGRDGELLTFYQPIHNKRLINGFVARAPLAAMEYYRASPSLMYLANETVPRGDLETDLENKMKALDVGYVVVHPDMLEPNRLREILSFLGHLTDLVQIPRTGELVVFRRELSAIATRPRDRGLPGI